MHYVPNKKLPWINNLNNVPLNCYCIVLLKDNKEDENLVFGLFETKETFCLQDEPKTINIKDIKSYIQLEYEVQYKTIPEIVELYYRTNGSDVKSFLTENEDIIAKEDLNNLQSILKVIKDNIKKENLISFYDQLDRYKVKNPYRDNPFIDPYYTNPKIKLDETKLEATSEDKKISDKNELLKTFGSLKEQLNSHAESKPDNMDKYFKSLGFDTSNPSQKSNKKETDKIDAERILSTEDAYKTFNKLINIFGL